MSSGALSLIMILLSVQALADEPPATPLVSEPFGAASPERTVHQGTSLKISLSRLYGDTHFEMNALTPDPQNPENLVPIRSRLEFPLDTALVGLRLQWQPGGGALRNWSFAVGLQTDIADPWKTMTDSDFFGEKQIYFAESDASLDMILVNSEVRYLLHRRTRATFTGTVCLDYERIKEHLVGYEGWQGSLYSDIRVPISGTEAVADYRITYWSPRLGVAATYRVADHATVGLDASSGPLWTSDLDDHLLRCRITEGRGAGVGLYSQARLELLPGILPSLAWLSADLTVDVRYFRVDGTSDQKWYDENGNFTGEETNHLAHDIESLQVAVSLGIRMSI
jgi:hypothetical protein